MPINVSQTTNRMKRYLTTKLYDAKLWLKAHSAFQRVRESSLNWWEASSKAMSGAPWRHSLCFPCRAVVGTCSSREPRTIHESWLRRLGHWGPIIAIIIIATVTLSSTYSALQLWSLPASVVPYMRGVHFCLMYLWLVPIFWNFFKAMKRGPGYVPLGWKPQKSEDEQFLQFCNECHGFKPPRTHHCKLCKRCVMKMDHHCPWINSCVGHANHTNFLLFLFFVPFGCMQGVVVNSNFLYHLLSYHFTFHRVFIDLHLGWVLFVISGISFGAGTALGVLILFLTQLKGILSNRTQIEDWILTKAHHRRERDKSLSEFTFPYNLGWRRNLSLVVNWNFASVGDGMDWIVKEGCQKYSFTIEQLEQKKSKRNRAISCVVKKSYDGSSCPVSSYGLVVAICAPRCMEAKVPVNEGDVMMVTRWERRWVYGSLMQASTEVKGWFPRQSIDLPNKYKKQRPKEDKSAAMAAGKSDVSENIDQLSHSGTPSSQSDDEERDTNQGDSNSPGKVLPNKARNRKYPSGYRHGGNTDEADDMMDEEKDGLGSDFDNGQTKLKKRHKKHGKRTTVQT